MDLYESAGVWMLRVRSGWVDSRTQPGAGGSGSVVGRPGSPLRAAQGSSQRAGFLERAGSKTEELKFTYVRNQDIHCVSSSVS